LIENGLFSGIWCEIFKVKFLLFWNEKKSGGGSGGVVWKCGDGCEKSDALV